MNSDFNWFINYGSTQAILIRSIYKDLKERNASNKSILEAIQIKTSPDNVKRTYLIYKTMKYLFMNQKGLDEKLYDEMYWHYEDLYVQAFDVPELYNSENLINNMISFYTKPKEEIKHPSLICEEDFSDYECDSYDYRDDD